MVVHYPVLLCLDPYDTDAIVTNKLCRLNFRYFTMYKQAARLSGPEEAATASLKTCNRFVLSVMSIAITDLIIYNSARDPGGN